MAELYKSVTELMKTARGNKALQGNLGDITDFQQIIDDTPTADVVEVKHGEWIKVGYTEGRSNILQCSCCKRIRRGRPKSPYCPDCGAKMDGGKNE